jgi:hypothetical protein
VVIENLKEREKAAAAATYKAEGALRAKKLLQEHSQDSDEQIARVACATVEDVQQARRQA